jgi:heme-degrading monooxygenase HmoA
MVIQFVKFKSGLPDERVLAIQQERAHQFRALPGLIQKYYYRDPKTGEYGAIFLWDSEEAQRAFRESELARTIPLAYEVEAPPRIEILDTIFALRA